MRNVRDWSNRIARPIGSEEGYRAEDFTQLERSRNYHCAIRCVGSLETNKHLRRLSDNGVKIWVRLGLLHQQSPKIYEETSWEWLKYELGIYGDSYLRWPSDGKPVVRWQHGTDQDNWVANVDPRKIAPSYWARGVEGFLEEAIAEKLVHGIMLDYLSTNPYILPDHPNNAGRHPTEIANLTPDNHKLWVAWQRCAIEELAAAMPEIQIMANGKPPIADSSWIRGTALAGCYVEKMGRLWYDIEDVIRLLNEARNEEDCTAPHHLEVDPDSRDNMLVSDVLYAAKGWEAVYRID